MGELSSVVRIVKVLGFVASAPDFTGQAAVINGASELLLEVFGTAVGTPHRRSAPIGAHARSAVGVAVLPRDAPVEVELIAEVTPASCGRRRRAPLAVPPPALRRLKATSDRGQSPEKSAEFASLGTAAAELVSDGPAAYRFERVFE